MKYLNKAILTVILLGVFSSANASVVHIWNCNLHDGKSGDDVVALSSSWLAAARTMEGGKDLNVYINFPMAANAGIGGFTFVLIAPDPATWGLFMNGYEGSAAAKADSEWDAAADCSSNSLWESVSIE